MDQVEDDSHSRTETVGTCTRVLGMKELRSVKVLMYFGGRIGKIC